MNKKNGAGRIRPVFRPHDRATVVKSSIFWHKTEIKINGTEIQSPEINHAPSSIHHERRQGYTVLEKQSLQQMVQRNLNSYMKKKKKKKERKKEIRSFLNTIHKN